ncbi:MAG TPA: LLM class flavin-dependent oxidoreductase [Solirubrobacteraceae bacterium]|nr:LLM class flavin-dependent oxidoreductase [Solirubrobacteraceae bacterium]HTX10474.1 LLM class flavin-dependent oxidoreductase [Solirubrobacteraceae bacterium]
MADDTTAPRVLDRIGLGLWTMRSMALHPRNRVADYRALGEDAVLAEQLGFHSIWSAEHRVWYDGWCPAPLHAQALVAGVTSRLRMGTAVLLATQHDPFTLARTAAVLDRCSGGRVDLGIGLGHRDVEFDTLGLRRDQRGRRMDEALEVLPAVWAGEHGDPPVDPGPAIWMGGMAPRALERAATKGCNVILPQTLRPHEVRRCIDTLHSHGDWNGTVGVLRDVWIENDPQRARSIHSRFVNNFREEAGWWILKGKPAYEAPDALERQMARVADASLMGTPDEVAEGLRALLEAGAHFLCLRINFDLASRSELREQMHRVASELPPRLADVISPLGVGG